MELKQQLESLQGYREHLVEKYEIGFPSWSKRVKTPLHAEKEVKRLTKRIDELSRCKRHNGVNGLDCMFCSLEGKF